MVGKLGNMKGLKKGKRNGCGMRGSCLWERDRRDELSWLVFRSRILLWLLLLLLYFLLMIVIGAHYFCCGVCCETGNLQDLGKEMPNVMDPQMLKQLGGSANIQNMLKQVAQMGGGGLGALKNLGGFK